MRKFSILIPSWDDYKYLKLCLESLREHSAIEHEILIHMNTYTEESLALARQYDPGCTATEKNEGIAYGTNRCAERASTDFLFLPNTDMVFLPGWDVAFDKAIDRYGEENFYSGTMIEPGGNNENFIIKNYGTEPENLQYEKLLGDLEGYKTGKFYEKHIVPFLIPTDIFVPYDERMWPGWTTDDDIAMSVYTDNPDIKFIRVADAHVYHFMMKCTIKIGDAMSRYRYGRDSQILFDNKWKPLYPGLNYANYREFIYSDFEGSSKL